MNFDPALDEREAAERSRAELSRAELSRAELGPRPPLPLLGPQRC